MCHLNTSSIHRVDVKSGIIIRSLKIELITQTIKWELGGQNSLLFLPCEIAALAVIRHISVIQNTPF